MIEDYSFGTMTIQGRKYHQDLKIVGGAVVESWWRKEGHSVEEEDVDDLLSAKPDMLVIGMGQPGRMQVTDSLRSLLTGRSILLIEEPTAQAILTFNHLFRSGKRVAGAFHLTC